MVGRLWRHPLGCAVLLAFLWAPAYLVNLGLRDLRLEEGRRAEPARGMLSSGDYVLPRLQQRPYLNKPPLYFWICAGVGRLHGAVDEWAVRLPAATSVLATSLLLLSFGRILGSPAATRCAAVVYLANAFTLDKGTLGEIDAFFTLLVLGAWRAWLAPSPDGLSPTRAGAAVAGLFLGAAVLAKGPPALAVFWLPVAAQSLVGARRGAGFWKRAAACAAISLTPAAAWLALLARHPDMIALAAAGSNCLSQMGLAEHAGASGYSARLLRYFGDALSMAVPWGFVAALGWRKAVVARAQADVRAVRLVAMSAVTLFVFFAVWPNGRFRYFMPAWPFVCLLAGVGIAGAPATCPGWLRRLAALLPALAGVVGAAVVATMLPSCAAPAIVGAIGALGVTRLLIVRGAPAPPDRSAEVESSRRAVASAGTPAPSDVSPWAAPAMSFAVAVLVGWFLFASLLFRTLKAPTDGPHQFGQVAAARGFLGRPCFTHLALPSRGRAFNHQFYFGAGLRPIDDFAELPVQECCGVLMDRATAARLADRPEDFDLAILATAADEPGRTLAACLVTRKAPRLLAAAASSTPADRSDRLTLR